MLLLINDETFVEFCAAFSLKPTLSETSSVAFFDTHCDELARRGFYLSKTESFFELKTFEDGLSQKAKAAKNAKFFWDFEDGEFKTKLRELIEYRALVLKESLKIEKQTFLAVNKNHKGVFRAYLYKFNDVSLLNLEPIRGFTSSISKALKFLEGFKTYGSIYDFIKKPAPKIQKQTLNVNMSAKEAIAILLNDAFLSMRGEENGVKERIDSEFLHYYRVELRKIRALISQFKTVFKKDAWQNAKTKLSSIGKATNMARDLDVYWLKVREYAEQNPNKDLTHFLSYLQEYSKKEYKTLAKFLKSKEYEHILSSFETLMASGFEDDKSSVNITTLAAKKIKAAHKKTVSDGLALNAQSEDYLFHELRIDFKKLRYLLEFFNDILNKEQASQAVKATKNIQAILGSFQDLTVQCEKITHFAEEMNQSVAKTDAKTLITIGTLVGDLEREQKKYKKLFLSAFEDFVKQETQALFENVTLKVNSENNSDI